MAGCSYELKAAWLGARRMRWRTCSRGRMRPSRQRCEAGEASKRDVGGNGLPRCAGLGAWMKRESRTADCLAKSAPGMTRAQNREQGSDVNWARTTRSGSVGVPRAFEAPYGSSTSPAPCHKRPPQPPSHWRRLPGAPAIGEGFNPEWHRASKWTGRKAWARATTSRMQRLVGQCVGTGWTCGNGSFGLLGPW